MEKLAIEGGPKAKRTPFGPRKRHGEAEKRNLAEVIDSDVLFYHFGAKVREFERRLAALYGRRHAVACSSGTAAVHIALAALELPPGSEVITTCITDMGSVIGMLYQGLVPVFADVDPETLNMDPASVRERITGRTRAILAVHHSGLAADMDALDVIARRHGIPIVEDCAQAWFTWYRGRLAGTMAPLACFSLNHFKHITCGSGGVLLTSDDRLRYLATLYLDKCYQREEKIRNPFFLAPNYQMTELEGAVALAQLEVAESFVAARGRVVTRLNELLTGVLGVTPQRIPAGLIHSGFLYLFRLDLDLLGCTARQFSAALNAEDIPNDPHMITGGRPVHLYDIFQNRSAFPGSEYPFSITGRVYRRGDCPVAEAAFNNWITMNPREHWTDTDIEEIASGIAKVARHFAAGRRTAHA